MLKLQTFNINPLNDEKSFYLPYFDLIARSTLREYQVEFQEPVIETGDPISFDCDIYLFSCYVWNIETNYRFAKEIKEKNSKAKIIFGGPHINKDEIEISGVDIFTTEKVEVFLPRLMASLMKQTGPQSYAGKEDKQSYIDFIKERSPYLENKDFLKRLIEKRRNNRKLYTFWETNRGCPYKCQFCDWGGYTNSKIHMRSMGKIENEILLFSTLEVEGIKCLDANFGILKRDFEIIDLIGKIKEKHHYPKFFSWVPSKSNSRNIIDIAKASNKYGLDQKIVRIDLQSTDLDILNNVARSNIKLDELITAIEEISKFNKVGTGIILGLPGETLETFKKTLLDTIELGIEDEFEIYPFSLLPNAPANNSTYKEKMKLETIEVPLHIETMSPPLKDEFTHREKIVVETISYGKDEWVQMNIWSSFIQACHKYGLTRYIAKDYKNISGFYEKLFHHIQEIFPNEFSTLENHWNNFLLGTSVNRISYNNDIWLSPERWFFYKILGSYDYFLDRLEGVFPGQSKSIYFQRTFFARIEKVKEVKYSGLPYHYNFENSFEGSFQPINLKEHYQLHMKRLYGPKGPRGFYSLNQRDSNSMV